MPEDLYKVGPAAKRQFDDLGLRALERDWAAWRGEPSNAQNYAMYFVERRPSHLPPLIEANPQRYFGFDIRE